jgi:hypothetical protein
LINNFELFRKLDVPFVLNKYAVITPAAFVKLTQEVVDPPATVLSKHSIVAAGWNVNVEATAPI